MSQQLDLFGDAIEEGMKQVQHYFDLSTYYTTKALDLRKDLQKTCTHPKLDYWFEEQEDEYGKSWPSWTLRVVRCRSCTLERKMNNEDFMKFKYSNLEVLVGRG